jgi:L-aspartate oxidase
MSVARRERYDAIVIGAGIAGLSAAISAAERGLRVAVLSKEDDLLEANTYYAQGGIVGYSGADCADQGHRLVEDIVRAGDHVNYLDAVRQVVTEGPALVDQFLIRKIGVPFTTDESGRPSLTREAAHSVRRIYYAMDSTGKAIQEHLVAYARGLPSITLMPRHTAIDFITNIHNSKDAQERYRETRVIGVYALDEGGGAVASLFAPTVIAATGGVGNLFLHTSNPIGATGDGIAMAYRIGAEVLNAEYVQFHPTILYHRDKKRFLISEALRGEGATLINHAGAAFVHKYNPEGDLAPRDEVARAIYREMEREDSEYVKLDASGITDLDLAARFPSIFQTCRELGIDIRKEPIPVVPAAHYSCGGIKVDLSGAASITGLYAAGEAACTGVHGANRLASISLLEGLVWGIRAGRSAVDGNGTAKLSPSLVESVPDWVEPSTAEEIDPVLLKQDFRTIRSTMWNYAGIIRSRKRLVRAQADLDYLSHRIEQFYRSARLTRQIIELRNSVLSASLIVRAALKNPVSLGCHYIE